MAIKSTLHAIDNKEFSCHHCLSKYSSRPDSAKMTEISRNTKGCFSVGDRVLHSINREIEFKTCIGNFYSPWVVHWLEMHAHFENGVLPYPGSMMDQPNKAIEVFRTITQYKIERAIKEQERERQRAKRGR